MKKIKIWLFAIPLVVLLFTSCYKETYVPVPSGSYMNTYYIDVVPNNWQLFRTASQEYQYVSVSMKEITGNVLNYGAVICYLVGEQDNMLPYVASYDDGQVFYTQNIRFDMSLGQLTFVLENNDLDVPTPNYAMKFKVCIIQNY